MFVPTSPRRACSTAVAMVLLLALVLPTRAQSVLESGSLQVVPADAAFYGASLRLGEQVEILRDSKLYAALRFDPFIQAGLAQAKNMLAQNDDYRQFMELVQQPENQQLITLLKQAVSEEFFVFGDEGFAEQLALINSMTTVVRSAQLEAARSGQDPEEVLPERLMTALLEHADHIAVPLTVFGFKIQDRDAALAQMTRLEQLLGTLLEDEPDLKSRLARRKIGQDEYLVWRLDGSLIPWDELPRENFEGDPEQLELLIEKLQQVTLSLSLGVHQDYLIFAVSKDESALARLSQGERLASVPEMQLLRKHADQRVTGIGYASGKFLERAANMDGQLDQLRTVAAGGLPLMELGDDLEKQVLDLVEEFTELVEGLVPRQGTLVSVDFLTPRGYEQFQYNHTPDLPYDDSRPLRLVQHVGGAPIAWFAGRGRSNPAANEKFAAWCDKALKVGDQVALAKLGVEERPVYEKLRDRLLPLLERLGEVNRTMLAPAFADGEFGLVLDARLTSTQPHQAMPASTQPLPLPELALVYSIQDPELIKKAAAEYFQAIQEGLKAAAEVAPDKVPMIELPPPTRGEIAGAEMYSYPLPPALQLDAKLAPNAALNANTLVLSLAPETSGRLLTPTPLAQEGVLAKTGQPLGAAGSFNFAGLIDAVIPWLNYGIVQAQGEDSAPAVMGIARNYLRMLQCFRGVNMVTYREGDVWVTHSETLLSDLE